MYPSASLRCAQRVFHNQRVRPQEEAELRNTLYSQQTRSRRRLTRGRLWLYKLLVPLAAALIRLVWRWSRVSHVSGAANIRRALVRAPSFIPVYWHQSTLFCVKQLLDARKEGLKLGFLISPSVDGEIGALLVDRLGASTIRGSSSYTGARALRDYFQALLQDQISPAITPDGPKGPPWKFKPGAILLAQWSQRPIVPMAFAASSAWHIQWDRFIIPRPFAHVAVVVGEPVYFPKRMDELALQHAQEQMEQLLNNLQESAVIALSSIS